MKKKLLRSFVILLVLILPKIAVAQRAYPCFQLSQDPVLSGKLEGGIWQKVPEATGFMIHGKSEFAMKRQTYFKAAWTHDSLYFAIRCAEPSPDQIKAIHQDGGNLWEDDDVEIFLLPPGAAVPLQFVVNAKGSRWSGVDGALSKSLDWTVVSAVSKQEWRAEIKIPFSVLGQTPGLNDTWKVSIARTINSEPASDERNSNWGRLVSGFNDVENFPVFTFREALSDKIDKSELERQMNNPALALQKTLQGKLVDLRPIYQKFQRIYDKFKLLASPSLQEEAGKLTEAMGSLEKLAESKEPNLQKVEEALKIDLGERLASAISSCSVKVSLAKMANGIGSWVDDGKYRLWCDPVRVPEGNPCQFIFNSAEQKFEGNNSTKLDYSWPANGGRVLLGAPAPIDNSSNFEPHLGLWVYGNGSGDELYDLPINWVGWRYVDLNLYKTTYPNYIIILNHKGKDLARSPIYFGGNPVWYDAGVSEKTLLDSPSAASPFPFYLAGNEVLNFPLSNGLYEVEIGLAQRVNGSVRPQVFVNESLVDDKSEVLKGQCELKEGILRVKAKTGDRKFTGIRFIKISRENQTVAYCDATILSQTKRTAEIKAVVSSIPNPPFTDLETNAGLYEPELGGKQLVAAPRIVYQFKLDSGKYKVRLRFNRWRGTYPGDAKSEVLLQGEKVMEITRPNAELLSKEFNVTVDQGLLQLAVLGLAQESTAWLGDISIFQGDKMIGFIQPSPSIPDSENGNYSGLRNLVQNPSFEVPTFERNWISIAQSSKSVRTNAEAHQGDYSLCIEPTVGPAGVVSRYFDARRSEDSPTCSKTLRRKILAGKLKKVSPDEHFVGENGAGAPIDYTRPYRFTAWVKSENPSDQAYLQIVWITNQFGLATKPLIPESPKLLAQERYYTIVGVSESVKISGSSTWQKISMEATPPYGASQAQFILRTDDNKGKVYFDDLDFDGFGSNPVEIVLPQIGYHPNGEKMAFVKTRTQIDKGSFKLQDPTGKTVYSGSLKPAGLDAWGFYLSRADFSKCRTEGQYTLKVMGDGLPEVITSPFSISSSLYRNLGLVSINSYFHSSRCGTEIPGWHPACHLDMAAIRNGYACGQQPEYFDKNKPKGAILKHVDLTGGWHDAGSLDKYGYLMAPAAIAMCRFWEDTQYLTKDLQETYPDALSEASWGIDYIMRSIDIANGKVYDNPIEWNPVTKDYICLGSNPTDNIIGTLDDPVCRGAMDLKSEESNPKAIRPVALTRLAKNLQEFDPAKAKLLMDRAGLWHSDDNFALALARYQVDKSADLTALEALARKKISPFLLKRYPYLFAKLGTQGDFVELFDFAKLCPKSKVTDDLKGLVRRICDQIFKPLSENNIYGVVDGVCEPVMTRAFSSYFAQSNEGTVSPEKYLQVAYFFIQAGELLHDPTLIRLAEHQIQFLLGRNPQGLSMVGGAGSRVVSIATLLYPYGSEYLKHKGQIPGSVGTMYTVSDGSMNWLHSQGPLDFPIPQTASERLNTFASSGEVYEVPVGWLIQVCGALDLALKEKK